MHEQATATVGSKPLRGTVSAPPSKSAMHRALIAAALSGSRVRITPHWDSQDILATLDALAALGGRVEKTADAILLDAAALGQPRQAVLRCRESGSTLRFLIPVAAALGVSARFEGAGRLPQRPLADYRRLLPEHGVRVSAGEGLPLSIEGRLRPGRYAIGGDVSSQYITGLLFALPLLDGDSEIVLTTPLESKGYIDLTLDLLRAFGVQARETATGYMVPGRQRYCAPAAEYRVEGDWSQAAFFLCAGALGGDVRVTGLLPDSRQGDRAVAEILRRLGASVTVSAGEVRVRPGLLRGCGIDASQIPDLVPALAVVCAAAEGVSEITGAARLRLKESDRLAAMAENLRRCGVEVEEGPDRLRIVGRPRFLGGERLGFNDHRIVMAMSVAALRGQDPFIIRGAESIEKSYPGFFEDFTSLGGQAHVVCLGE